MKNSHSDELYRLHVENDIIQLEKTKAKFEKSYNELLKELKAKNKELGPIIKNILSRLSDKQKEVIMNDIKASSSQQQLTRHN